MGYLLIAAIVLNVDEQKKFDKLTPGQQRYADVVLNGKIPIRTSLANMRIGNICISRGAMKVSQVIDEDSFLDTRSGVWIDGVKTSHLKNGDRINMDGLIFYCSGNKKYVTAIGGSNTVMQVTRVRPDRILDTVRPIAQARGYRVWGEGTGNLLIAKYLKSTSRSVTVEFVNGKRKTLKKKYVAPLDWKWAEAQRQERKRNDRSSTE